MTKKMRNALYISGLCGFLFSLAIIFYFKKEIMGERLLLASRTLQSSIDSRYSVLKQQVARLAKVENSLRQGEGELRSATLSESSVEFLGLIDAKKSNGFLWSITSKKNFQTLSVAKSILQQAKKYLSVLKKSNGIESSAVFPLKIIANSYFALVVPYTEGETSSWVLAIVPRLSFVSWLPFSTSGEPFSLLNSSSEIISDAKHSYISQKIAKPWITKQGQLGLLENHRFVYKNLDFTLQVFSKIENSPLLLISSWSMNFWPLFFQLFIFFFFVFFLSPSFIYYYFGKTEQLAVEKTLNQTSKDSKLTKILQEANEEVSLQKKELGLENSPALDQDDLLSLQELPAHSSIIKDLKVLIDDLDSKPLSKTDTDLQSILAEEERGL